jgi:hypothetical protein
VPVAQHDGVTGVDAGIDASLSKSAIAMSGVWSHAAFWTGASATTRPPSRLRLARCSIGSVGDSSRTPRPGEATQYVRDNNKKR